MSTHEKMCDPCIQRILTYLLTTFLFIISIVTISLSIAAVLPWYTLTIGACPLLWPTCDSRSLSSSCNNIRAMSHGPAQLQKLESLRIFILTHLAYKPMVKNLCSILQQFTGWKCTTLSVAVLWRHPSYQPCLFDVWWCNVVFTHYKCKNYM